jgi:TonB family protein
MTLVRIFALAGALSGVWSGLPAQTPTPTPTQLEPSQAPSPSASVADSTQLEVAKVSQPDYPLEAAAKRLQGKVLIKMHILETGDVERTEIVSGEPILAQAAADAMKSWKFKPFIKDGKPVRVSTSLPYTFSLKGYFPEGCAAVESAEAYNAAHHPQVPQKVMEGALTHRVAPEYPLQARLRHLQGTVLLYAVIGEDGKIRDLKALCGAPEFIPACLEAIRQWRYRPYLVDGVPVEVQTTIKVQFHM